MKSGILVGTAILLLVLVFAWLIRDLYLPGDGNATVPPDPVACTADAKLCPDGTAVGRIGPHCEFAPCPGDDFLACEAAGNPIMESYPRQCRWENGTTVTEVILPREEMTQPSDPLACRSDADCVVKDVGSCCGHYPRCVNAGYEPDPEAVKAACAESGVSGVCGYPVIDYCVCSNNACEGRQN